MHEAAINYMSLFGEITTSNEWLQTQSMHDKK